MYKYRRYNIYKNAIGKIIILKIIKVEFKNKKGVKLKYKF
jgi:hypothetical protein